MRPSVVNKPYIRVSAGLILRPDGQLLLGQRPQGKPWAGWWELPGGKLDAGETVLQALERELHEELGIVVTHATRWVRYVHEYTDNVIELNFCRVTGWQGTPSGRENQALQWIDPRQLELPVAPVLPATLPPLRWLRLPQRYLLTQLTQMGMQQGVTHLENRLKDGVRLVQFREPNWMGSSASLHAALADVLALCRRWQATCLVNSRHPLAWAQQADGLHVRFEDAAKADVRQFAQSTSRGLLAVSVHDQAQIQIARALAPDFMVAGHVLPTPSHPDRAPLGWENFCALIEAAGCPVYAIGGQSRDTLAQAQHHGAHGIAGMRLI